MIRPSPTPVARLRLVTAAALILMAATSAGAGVQPAAGSSVPAIAATDTVRLSVVPTPLLCQPGDTLLVELNVPVAGPSFNAYDAYLTYDPAVLRFLPAANVSTQEGPLMTTACGLRFHVFEADTLAGRLRVSHSLMCAGRSMTGPGVVYRVRFRCLDADADTPLSLLLAAPYKTTFFFAGSVLSPLVTTDAMVRVGAGSTASVVTPRVGVSDLKAAPNPFNPRTTISFTATQAGSATVDILTIDGRRVRRLWNGTLESGQWRGEWDGRDGQGREVSAGVYLISVHGPLGMWTTRVSLVK